MASDVHPALGAFYDRTEEYRTASQAAQDAEHNLDVALQQFWYWWHLTSPKPEKPRRKVQAALLRAEAQLVAARAARDAAWEAVKAAQAEFIEKYDEIQVATADYIARKYGPQED